MAVVVLCEPSGCSSVTSFVFLVKTLPSGPVTVTVEVLELKVVIVLLLVIMMTVFARLLLFIVVVSLLFCV